MNRVTTALATAFQENEMNRYRRFQLRTLAATLMLVIALAAVAAPPAQAQNSITLFLQTQYARSSFGRQVSFTMEPVYATGNQLTGATLVVNLPHGVSFVSADPDSFDGVTVASVTGSSASGVQVTLNIGQARSNFLVLSNILTVSIDNAVADGTILQATFELSGTLSSTGATADSGAVSIQFQVGYLPLSVFVASYEATCEGHVQNADLSANSFKKTSNTGLPASGSVQSDLTVGGAIGGFPAIATGGTDQLSSLGHGIVMPTASTPVQVGDITGATSVVRLAGIAGSASASGGVALLPFIDLPTRNLSAIAQCGAVSMHLAFSNPNPYSVPLIVDQRSNVFLAHQDFGFFHTGSVSTDLTVGNGNVTDPGSGVATSTIFERQLDTPNGNTLQVAFSISCFPDDQSGCESTPPSDTTKSTRSCVLFFSGFGCDLVPPGASTAALLEFRATDIEVEGGTVRNASNVPLIPARLGYGTGAGAVSLRIYRGDTNLSVVQAGEPAKLKFTGGSPIELVVSDAQGRKVGFQPAPSPPPQFLDAQPSVLAEIPGASYSGIDSHPQVITILDPKPGDYQVEVHGTGTGSFMLQVETLTVDDDVLDTVTTSGAVFPGSSESFTVTIKADGRLPGADTIPPTTTASLSPQPNEAGWNKSDVTVTLTAVDNSGGSGVKEIHFALSGAKGGGGVTSGAVSSLPPISSEGDTTVTFFAVDNAGNQETPKTLTVRIDKTPPELTARCAPSGESPFVAGLDSLSGVDSVTRAGGTTSKKGEFKGTETFTILDRAGNRLVARFGVKAEGREARFSLLSLTYNGGSPITLAANEMKCEFASMKSTGATEIEQKLELKNQGTEVEAKFQAEKNVTRIEVETGGVEQQLTQPGPVFLNLTTNRGALGFGF